MLAKATLALQRAPAIIKVSGPPPY